jgi:hypothetical protein
MSFFSKLKDRMFKSSSKLDEGLDAIIEDGATEDETRDTHGPAHGSDDGPDAAGTTDLAVDDIPAEFLEPEPEPEPGTGTGTGGGTACAPTGPCTGSRATTAPASADPDAG